MVSEDVKPGLNWKSYLVGAAFVFVAMLVFRLLLPAIMEPDMVLAIAAAAIGVMAWFIFTSRKRAD